MKIAKTALIVAVTLLAGCATQGIDPAGEAVQHYYWHAPVRIISAPYPADGIEVRLNPTVANRVLVAPTMGRRGMLALAEQGPQFLMDLDKNREIYRSSLLAALERQHMDCSPGADTPWPTRFAFEFTLDCGAPTAANAARELTR